MSDRAMRSNDSTRLTIPLLILAIVICLAPFVSAQAGEPEEPRLRARALGIVVGSYTPGPLNAITDVAGVTVGQTTLISGDGPLKPGFGPIRTGVTVVIPRDDVWHKKVPAGSFVLNGTGEMTGLAWISESGFLEYPIALTNTLNVPRVANGVMSWMIARYPEIGITDDTLTPVVAECDDGRLNDIQGRHVSEADVVSALNGASSGVVQEGSVGAGTGMVSYGFKGGIGTSAPGQSEGSIIVIIATDAPLDSRQLTRLAKRAALGLARTGSTARHGSGDFMLAFSTANIIPHYPKEPTFQQMHLADTYLNPLITATVEATEEAILNALTMATTVVGRDGHRVEAISLTRLRTILDHQVK